MRTTLLIAAFLLGFFSTSMAKEEKKDKKLEQQLDSIALDVVRHFGAQEYYDLCQKAKPTITVKKFQSNDANNGRPYYEVVYATPKDLKFEFDFMVEVYIWLDFEPFIVNFGCGNGFVSVSHMLKQIKEGKPIQRVPFVTVKDNRQKDKTDKSK